MHRLSIAGLMGWVLVIAMGFTALKHPNVLFAEMISFVTLTVLGMTTLTSLYARGAKRAANTGFSLFAAGYLMVAFGPGFAEPLRTFLPTTRLINYACNKMDNFRDPTSLSDSIRERLMTRLGYQIRALKLNGGTGKDPEIAKLEKERQLVGDSLMNKEKGWIARIVKPIIGGEDDGQFHHIGHCLSALLAGVIGSLIALRIYRKWEASEGPPTLGRR